MLASKYLLTVVQVKLLLPTKLVTSFSLQILHDVHKGGRSHRDIKPHNIMVSWKNGKVTVSLIDWAGSRLDSECKHPVHTCFDMCLLFAYHSTNNLICKAFMHVWHLHERMHDQACECHIVKDINVAVMMQQDVSAGHLLNAAYTASYAAPQLIRY